MRHIYIDYPKHCGFSFKRAIYSAFSEYETPKLVLMHSSRFAILLRVMQTIILLYSVAYLLIYDKGYQKRDTSIISAVTLKVKGIGYIHTSRNETIVVDGADYVVPPSENQAIFIMTNLIRTDQKRSRCPESILTKEAICQRDNQCENQPRTSLNHGRWTGRCILSSEMRNSNRTTNMTEEPSGLCEYAGWCPPEDSRSPPMLVKETLNFTIFIKNFIEFPAFRVKHGNMVDNLKSCTFHPETNKDCPIFTLDYIVNKAEKDLEEQNLMLRYGGVIRVNLHWNCNLDRNIKLCKAVYSFARLDAPFREKPFSMGFNFRYASHWKEKSVQHRSLTKAFGLRLVISVSGKAGKFHFITLTLNTGSLVGIFGLATFLCDIFLLHFSENALIYRSHVFESVHLQTRSGTMKRPAVDEAAENSCDKDCNLEPREKRKMSKNNRKSQRKTVNTQPLPILNSNILLKQETV